MDRLRFLLERSDAGRYEGAHVYLKAWRLKGTHGKKGAVVAFQTTQMKLAVALLGFGGEDRLLHLLAPIAHVGTAVACFETDKARFEDMSDLEAVGLISTWFSGDDKHTMVGTDEQCTRLQT